MVQNDGRLDDDNYTPWKGEVGEFKMTDLFDMIQDEEVTDLYTESDGTMWICYNNEEEEI